MMRTAQTKATAVRTELFDVLLPANGQPQNLKPSRSKLMPYPQDGKAMNHRLEKQGFPFSILR
jgi:hypothetical protein